MITEKQHNRLKSIIYDLLCTQTDCRGKPVATSCGDVNWLIQELNQAYIKIGMYEEALEALALAGNDFAKDTLEKEVIYG